MKSDIQGCSTCPPGEERYEEFNFSVQYDYRTPEGLLFSCVARSLEAARARRDVWRNKCSQCGVAVTEEMGWITRRAFLMTLCIGCVPEPVDDLSPDETMAGVRESRVGRELASVLGPEPQP